MCCIRGMRDVVEAKTSAACVPLVLLRAIFMPFTRRLTIFSNDLRSPPCRTSFLKLIFSKNVCQSEHTVAYAARVFLPCAEPPSQSPASSPNMISCTSSGSLRQGILAGMYTFPLCRGRSSILLERSFFTRVAGVCSVLNGTKDLFFVGCRGPQNV